MQQTSFDIKVKRVIFNEKYLVSDICSFTGIADSIIYRSRTKKRNYLNLSYNVYSKLIEYYNYKNKLYNDDNYLNLIKEVIFNTEYKISDMNKIVKLNRSAMSFYRNKKRDYHNISLSNSIKCVNLYNILNKNSLNV